MRYTVTDKAGRTIERGDAITSFRGEPYTFDYVERGVEYNGTAKVSVLDAEGRGRTFYDRVFDLTVVTVDEGR